MSSQPIGGLDEFDDLTGSSSWDRARDEDTSINRVGRAEWMVRVGDGDRHRTLFALDDGEIVGECDCQGYRHHDRCAHLAALLLAYVRQDVVPADVATPVDAEVNALWAARADGGDDRARTDVRGGRR